MNDISILHLSDLHIDGKKNTYSRLLSNLIKDISIQIKHLADQSLVVVVTGDIFNQGPKKADNSKAYDNAILFFSDLHKVIKDKAVAIYIVPGNHDKYRSDKEKYLVPVYRASNHNFLCAPDFKPKFDESFYDNFWSTHLLSYENEEGTGYINLVKEVNKIFGVNDEVIQQKSYLQNTFGVDVLDVLGKKYCFVLLNTAWSCIDEYDDRNIIIGDFQISKINQEFSQLVNRDKKVELTIVLGHHPIGSLLGEEEDKLFSQMTAFEGLEANAYLCGHTHNRTVNNWVNNRHSINTFVTGIGWPEENDTVGEHTYSMYVFNINANSIDVYVRSTQDDGSFTTDFKIYGQNKRKNTTKLVFPIKNQNAQTYITLNVGEKRSSKAYYISGKFLNVIKKYFTKMENFRNAIDLAIEQNKHYIYDYFTSIVNDDEKKELYSYFFNDSFAINKKIQKKIHSIFSRDTNEVFVVLLSFFERICEKLSDILLEEIYEAADIVRFHFRYLANRDNLTYSNLCSYIYNNNEKEFSISEIVYGQLIEQSFEDKCSLIYLVNKEYAPKGLKERWYNFITVVPLFDDNKTEITKGLTKFKVPFITFGVTTNKEKYDELLYCMDYFELRNSLDNIISSYLELFAIDIEDFCSWLNTYKEKGDHNE